VQIKVLCVKKLIEITLDAFSIMEKKIYGWGRAESQKTKFVKIATYVETLIIIVWSLGLGAQVKISVIIYHYVTDPTMREQLVQEAILVAPAT
jgi:hypothetical protein